MSQASPVKQASLANWVGSSYLNRPIVSDCTKLLFEWQNNIKCVDQIKYKINVVLIFFFSGFNIEGAEPCVSFRNG